MTWNPPFNVKLNKDLETAGTVTGSKFVDTTKNLLSEAALWFDASYSGGGQTIRNLGYGGRQLDGQNGSTSGADTNDALHLNWPGDNAGNYVYLPGVEPNRLTLDDSPAVSVTGDLELICYAAFDDWSLANVVIFDRQDGTTVSYRLMLSGAGQPWFRFWDGATLRSHVCSAAVGFADGEAGWIKVTLDVDNGAGAYEVKFFTSSDGSTWTQLGATVTGASTTTVDNTSRPMTIGSQRLGPLPTTMKLYRFIVKDGIDGTTVLDVDTSVISSGSATSFTALTGQTVTINRSTSGRKSVAVCQPTWLFGTDDFMEVANNALLNFDTEEAFSVVYVYRIWDTPASLSTFFAKRAELGDAFDANSVGYSTRTIGSTRFMFQVNSESHYARADRSSLTAGFRAGVISFNNNSLRHYLDGIETTGTLSGGATFRNDLPLRVGSRSGVTPGSFGDFELYALALFRRELTDTERDAMVTYWTNRIK